MSRFIPLGRAPKSREDRESLIADQVAKEERMANMGSGHVRKAVVEYLLSERGFKKEDIELEREFSIKLGEDVFKVKSDIVIKLEGKAFLLVKCAMTSPDSWERYAIAMSRVACGETIPFCLVTDGEFARLIDIRTGQCVIEGFDKFPSRQEAINMVDKYSVAPFICDKAEKEKRILFAFEGISCPTAEEKL